MRVPMRARATDSPRRAARNRRGDTFRRVSRGTPGARAAVRNCWTGDVAVPDALCAVSAQKTVVSAGSPATAAATGRGRAVVVADAAGVEGAIGGVVP